MTTEQKWLKQNDMLELADMLKALAHVSRVSILFLLCTHKTRRMTVKNIYEELKMSQPVISRHLGILKNSGLLLRFAEGSHTYYELNLNNRHANKIASCFSTM